MNDDCVVVRVIRNVAFCRPPPHAWAGLENWTAAWMGCAQGHGSNGVQDVGPLQDPQQMHNAGRRWEMVVFW